MGAICRLDANTKKFAHVQNIFCTDSHDLTMYGKHSRLFTKTSSIQIHDWFQTGFQMWHCDAVRHQMSIIPAKQGFKMDTLYPQIIDIIDIIYSTALISEVCQQYLMTIYSLAQ